ncbi:hypothetical protein [Streptomyces bottropensis]|uniref:hypothetical protein n=1 Tax=Streptomyces bottropensis TaxID=42235 RepID=UPI0036978718
MATTAHRLIAYRLELREAGLDHDLVNDMVRDAAKTLVMNEGLLTKPHSSAPAPPDVPGKALPPHEG